ncbi:MAG TPA: hypothetical protein VGP63_20920 [Planctomycetaceae bacterium]|jgi:hypothetical protein|nr:hypothetical protein [Planctomycetaceae bacterium]
MQVAVTTVLLAAMFLQPPDLPPFVKERGNQLTYYYKSPRPELGPVLLKELLEQKNVDNPWFAEHQHVLHLLCSQLGDIAAGKPKLVRKYEAAFSNASLSGRLVILDALQNCADKTTLKQVGAWLADPQYDNVRPELQALSRRLSDRDRKYVRDRPAQTPDDLDLLWANFFITGEYAPAARILDVIELPDTSANRALKGAAVWSMRSNLHQHPKLVELVQKHANERSPESQRQIGQLIKASSRPE